MIDFALELAVTAGASAAPSPGETKTLLELFGAVLGVTKWPVAGLVLVAAAIAVSNYNGEAKQQSTAFYVAFVLACGAGGWFLAGLMAS